jgi:Xaa-Pro aminopeptidase
LQEAAQDVYEAAGHKTTRSHPGTNEGYVHSLGHGVGLNIHERPSLSHFGQDILQRGTVISIEPGLYYPDQGYGVRLEDLFLIDEQGDLINLTGFKHDLVVPINPD